VERVATGSLSFHTRGSCALGTEVGTSADPETSRGTRSVWKNWGSDQVVTSGAASALRIVVGGVPRARI